MTKLPSTLYINCGFYFLYSDDIWSLGTALSRVSQFLATVNGSSENKFFKFEPIKPEPTTQRLLYRALTL